jgi:hypothetical protein
MKTSQAYDKIVKALDYMTIEELKQTKEVIDSIIREGNPHKEETQCRIEKK